MNYTGYSVLEIPKTGAAFSYAKEARDFATGATGVGGYLNSTAVSNSWTDVRFISAIYEGSTSLPLSIGATLPDLYTGAATVIGGSTPIGDLRSEDGPYVGVGNSSVYDTKKGQEYGAAFYATYIGGTNSAPTKIGIGTTSTDISTSGYYEGSFTTREIYEFETSFTPDLDDLTKTITGSGVYKNGDSVSLQFNILNRNGELLTSAAQIAADPFIDKQVISILDVDSNVVFPNYRDNGDSTFTFSRSQNIDVFGAYTRNFGVRNEIVNKNGLTSTGEFYLYGNTTTFDNILVQASGETVLNENLSNHSPPDTGSITSAADRADAIKYFNNQPVNTSGSTGFIELSLAFNEDPTFTEYSNLNIWASDTENFDSNIGNFIGSFPLDFSQEGQTIRLTPDNGIQDGTGLFFKLAVESSVEFEKEVFNLGPFTIEPIVEGPDLNLYNQGDQSMVGDFTIEGGLEGDSSNGGNLNVSGNALGTGIGGRLTGPESKMYLLSGDAGTESDTLQSVTARGNTTLGLDVNFQDGTLFVDHTNQRVGVGTNIPQDTLEVVGDSFFDGNVGIGTSNPSKKLEVIGDISGQSLFLDRGSNSDMAINFAGTNNGIYCDPAINMRFAVDSTNKAMVLASNNIQFGGGGNSKITWSTNNYLEFNGGGTKAHLDSNGLGIGITAPTVALDVAGAGKFTSQVTIPATPSASTDAASKGYVDSQVGSVTLQEATDNGNTTTNDVEFEGSAGVSFNSNSDLSIKPDTVETDTLYFGTKVRKIEGQYVAIGSTSNTMELFPTNSVTVGGGGTIVGASPATGSAILAGTGNSISGHFNTLVGGAQNKISGDLLGFNFIGGGSGIDITGSQYSSSIGGENNDISSSDYSIIGGGRSNHVLEADFSIIGGGQNNIIKDKSSLIGGGESNEINFEAINGGYNFIGAGVSNTISGGQNSIAGGNNNIISGSRSIILGGAYQNIGADDALTAGNYSEVQAGHHGAFVFSDSNSTPTLSTGINTATLNFQNGVYVQTDSGLYVNGNPVMTGINPYDEDTLQSVTDRGNETTTSIISTGPYISGVTGLFNKEFHVGDLGSDSHAFNFEKGDGLYDTNIVLKPFGNPGGFNSAYWMTVSKQAYSGFITNGNNSDFYIGHDLNKTALKLEYDGGGVSTFSTSNTDINFEDGTLFVDESAERVGIGTTNPTNDLHVVGTMQLDNSVSDAFKIRINGGVGLALDHNSIRSTNAGTDVTFAAGKDLIFQTYDGGFQEAMRIDTDGNVGIGTDSPTERVEVSGSLLLGPRSSGPGDTMPFLKIDGYDEHGIEMGWGTWTKWKITTKVNGQLEIYNTGIQHQSQQVSIGKQGYHKQGNLMVYSTGSVLRAGHNSTNYSILDIGVQDANSSYQGDAYIDVRADTTASSRFHFKRDGEFIASGVSVSGDVLGTGDGNRITNNGVPYLLSGDSPAETQTLQDVTTNGNTTTTSIISTGPYISGVTGYYKDTLRVGDGGFVDFPSEYDTLQVGTSSNATNGHILVRGKESSITFRGVEGSDKAHTIKEDAGTLTFYGDSTLSGTAGNARFAIQTGQSYFTEIVGVQGNGVLPKFYLANVGGGASNKATYLYQYGSDFRIALNGSQHNGTIGTDAFAIKSTYEVGVGTVDPRAALHVDNGAGATTGFLVENSSNKNILWAEDNESINARSTFNIYHTTNASRYLKLGWGSIFANDDGNELTLGSNYSSNSATRIFVAAESADNTPSDTIQMQANRGLAVFSGVSTDTFEPTALIDVRGDAYISGSVEGTGAGNRITNNGVPYLLSGDSPAETQTLQDVTDNGNTTTNAITVGAFSATGTASISGVLSIPSGQAVASEDVHYIVKLTQAEYDALTPDASTMYIITDEDFNSPVINPIKTVASNYTITDTDYTILVSGSSTVNITLPSATINSNYVYNIKNITTNSVVVTPSAGYIDGDISKTINQKFESIATQSDGSNWYII